MVYLVLAGLVTLDSVYAIWVRYNIPVRRRYSFLHDVPTIPYAVGVIFGAHVFNQPLTDGIMGTGIVALVGFAFILWECINGWPVYLPIALIFGIAAGSLFWPM